MPKEIEGEDGKKETVYTEEDVAGFKAGDEKNKERKEEINGLREELGLGEEDDLKENVTELQNSNFGKYRKKFKGMEKELGEGGKKFDDDGKEIDEGGQAPMTEEQVKRSATDATKEVLDENTVNSQLSGYSEEDRKSIKALYVKAKAMGGSLQENLDLAIDKIIPPEKRSASSAAFNNSGGGAPVSGAGKRKVTQEGEAMGKQFGNKKEDLEKHSGKVTSAEEL